MEPRAGSRTCSLATACERLTTGRRRRTSMQLNPGEALARIAESFSQSVLALSPSPRWEDASRYFPAGEPQLGDAAFDAELELINADFPAWLDPGPIEAPP